MLDDYFRIRYKKVPLAVSFQDSNTYITELHNHSEFEILLITCGSACITINNSSYFVKSGDMLFINPFEVHSVKPYDAAPYSHSCICFDCSLISEERSSEDIKNGVNLCAAHICFTNSRPIPLEAPVKTAVFIAGLIYNSVNSVFRGISVIRLCRPD